jgi:hypothetical protein
MQFVLGCGLPSEICLHIMAVRWQWSLLKIQPRVKVVHFKLIFLISFCLFLSKSPKQTDICKHDGLATTYLAASLKPLFLKNLISTQECSAEHSLLSFTDVSSS